MSNTYTASYSHSQTVSCGPGHGPALGHNQYARHSDADLALAFDRNFDAFREWDSPNASMRRIHEVANRPMTGNPHRDNEKMLASEILRRPQVGNALDSVDDYGRRDGIIGRHTPRMAAEQLSSCNGGPKPYPQPCHDRPPVYPQPCHGRPPAYPQPCESRPPSSTQPYPQPQPVHPSPHNVYKSVPDQTLALAFHNNFNVFKDPMTGMATTSRIQDVAGRAMVGVQSVDNMTLLAREVLIRPGLVGYLDSVDYGGRQDGIIGPNNALKVAYQLS
ncbi:hypothetical protein PspS35_17025 [Pseudomonas sp. S35]|uniref:hypothetical protein n=1 Tax=Pseudomonas sp. S35 TaxID=1573719 RepID=UPI00132F35F4|nr:hypothetical protein [Pseudomonas sp. S35]QHF45410.1 hypothetical protein PspS35_17025 [Pseudomonas sp. S35]